MITDVEQFLLWEQSTRDTIDFKKIYADAAGDVLAGLALSEIVYWYLPSNKGATKLRVEHNGILWIAIRRYEWWDRTRFSPKQADRALAILVERGLIAKDVFKFDGDPTIHVALIWERFLPVIRELSENIPVNPFLPNGKNEIPKTEKPNSESGNSLLTFGELPVTEITTETTKKSNYPSATPLGIQKTPAIEGVFGGQEETSTKKVKSKLPVLSRHLMISLYGRVRMSKPNIASIQDLCDLYDRDPIYVEFVDHEIIVPLRPKSGKPWSELKLEEVLELLRVKSGEQWQTYQANRSAQETHVAFEEMV